MQTFKYFGLFEPAHAASLAVTRILFGFLMLFDIPDERGGAEIDIRWGDPQSCHFPLFSGMYRPSLSMMCFLYGIMWMGALGVCLGYKFRTSCCAYLLPYWYILLLDKSFWNNHSYLYGLLGLLLCVSSAGNYWSLDALSANSVNRFVPKWNYHLLKFQIFCLYFIAGLKKLDMEWLEGYSMSNMGKHWVFSFGFGYLLSSEQIDYFVIHLMGFLLDLTVGFLLLMRKTRPLALLACGMFHLINSRLFSIGMFPYVCIATMPLFCAYDWPLKLMQLLNKKKRETRQTRQETGPNSSANKKFTLFFIVVYCFLQLFLPWSHFITKGYNNWTNGLYGYSWDMMVHSWDTTLVLVRIVDNENGDEHFLDPSTWTHNDRWNKHADMALQYAQCLQNNLRETRQNGKQLVQMSANLSIYLDVWCSLNGRFQQRMFNPHHDLLQAKWSPFENVEWLLPLLIEYSDLRAQIKSIQAHVYSWSNYSDVLFVADFPEFYLENFISKDLANISLVIIEGSVYYEDEDRPQRVRLGKGETIAITSNVFHKITTISETPSCFMYTFTNSTKEELQEVNTDRVSSSKSPMPLLEDSAETFKGFLTMFALINNASWHVFLNEDFVRRIRVE